MRTVSDLVWLNQLLVEKLQVRRRPVAIIN